MNPYINLDDIAYWKLAVAEKNCLETSGFWQPKFEILKTHTVATYGSCFAQHIGRAMRARGYKWLITEHPPGGFSDANKQKYNYDVFSSRTANIYTTSLLLQWLSWSTDRSLVPTEIWKEGDRFIDPFRPKIEPNGFKSVEELNESRNVALDSFYKSIVRADVFVFTLGLTERWFNSEHGYEYPMCPGTAAGEFDEKSHQFEMMNFEQVRINLTESIAIMTKLNPKLKFILTVSPVPLTATYSKKHVAVATIASKSILRAVAEDIHMSSENIDYFPSYELITSPIFGGIFYEPNKRSVASAGVNFVMTNFFNSFDDTVTSDSMEESMDISSDVACEEELLEAFTKK